jgi:formate dehydrogenase major subunit
MEMRALTPQYRGMSWERIGEFGLQWPCPTPDHPGTPILHKTSFPRGKAILSPLVHRPPAEIPDEDYPFVLSTGRMLAQFHTGSMSRRSVVLGTLVPEGHIEIHPADASRLGISKGELVRVSTRRGSIEIRAFPDRHAQEGTLFIPFHFAEAAANRLTNDALDPVAGIPEFKVCAVRIEKLTQPVGADRSGLDPAGLDPAGTCRGTGHAGTHHAGSTPSALPPAPTESTATTGFDTEPTSRKEASPC